MVKGKLSTPAWILEGFDSPAEYEKAKGIKKKKTKDEKTAQNLKNFGATKSRTQDFAGFRIKVCPKCGSDEVGVVLTGEEGKGAKEWECKKCKWQGRDIEEKELSEDEFMKYLDEKGEEVA